MENGDFDMDMAASALSADTDDVRVLLKALVTRLSAALGARMEVERAGSFLKRSDEIRRISITLGDDRLEAAVERDELICTVARAVAGIRIRSTKVTTQEWIRRLLGTLADEAANSQATRTALESLVIGGDT